MGGLRRKHLTSAGVVGFPVRDARCYHLLFGGTELQQWAWLDPSELGERVRAWLRGRANTHLGDLVPYLIDRGEAVTVTTMPRPAGPALPSLLANQPLDVATLARLEHATHVLRVEAANPPAPTIGFPGLWCAFATAATANAGVGAVWFDVGALRVRSLASAAGEPAPADGAVHIGDHLLLLQSRDEAGDLLTTTKGLAAFGLPELLLAGAPGHLGGVVALLLQGVAQRLLDGLVDEQTDGTPRGEVPVEVVVSSAHVARAAQGALVREHGATRVRIAYRAADTDGGDDHLVVEPDGDPRRSRGEWLTQVAAELLTTRSTPLQSVPARSPALQQAHDRAIAELAEARRMAGAGEPGQVVFVKRGFATSSGGTEYLWLVVDVWKAPFIRARVANEPAEVPELATGQSVDLHETEVFDWLVTRDGERVAGGWSIDALQQ